MPRSRRRKGVVKGKTKQQLAKDARTLKKRRQQEQAVIRAEHEAAALRARAERQALIFAAKAAEHRAGQLQLEQDMKMKQQVDGSIHIELEKQEAENIAADPAIDPASNPDMLAVTDRFVEQLQETVGFEEDEPVEEDDEDPPFGALGDEDDEDDPR